MPAFSERKMEALDNSVNTLFFRTLECLPQPGISKTEIHHALVKPEHRKLLDQTEELVGTIQSHNHLSFKVKVASGQVIDVGATFNTPLNHIMPDYYQQGFHADANEETVAKLDKWVKVRCGIGFEFAKAFSILHDLNDMMASPKQMKFFFDGIVGLCEMSDMKDIADKLREPFVPASFPSIDPAMRQGCKDATQAIARALLVDPDQKNKTPAVTFSIAHRNAGTARLPWKKAGSVVIW